MASHSSDGEFGFQIAPMLDVLFVLLLFFMVCAGTQKREANLSVQFPGRDRGPSDFVQINLGIDAEGQVTFNGLPMDTPTDHQLPQTLSRLRAIIEDTPWRPVVITPDPNTRHQRVVDVLNVCKGAHVTNLAFGSNAE